MTKKNIDPEELMRDSDFLNALNEFGNNELVETGKAFLKLDDFDRKLVGMSLGISLITQNRSLLKGTELVSVLLNGILDDTQKKLLALLFNTWLKAIRDHLEDKQNEEEGN